jgi:hypothetical protein
MKIYLFVFYLCLSYLSMSGQDPAETGKFIELNGFFFKYIPYELHLSNNKVGNNLKIESNKIGLSEIDYYDSSKVNLRFNILENGTSCLSIYDTLLKKGIKLNMKATDLPLTVRFFANQKEYASGSIIYSKDLINNLALSCKLINFDISVRFKVKKFDLIFVLNGKLHKYSSQDYLLTEEQVKALKMVKDKCIIVFDHIVVEGYNGDEMPANSLVFYLN